MIPFFMIYVPDRLQQALRTQAQFPNDITLVPAIDSRHLPVPKGLLAKGEVGCLLSHLSIIQHARILGLQYVGILEDDAILAPNFPMKALTALGDTPSDWQVLYLSHWIHRQSDVPTEQVAPKIFRAKQIWGCHSYILHASSFDSILKDIIRPHQIDDAIKHLPLVKYTRYPFISYQLTNQFSTITGRHASEYPDPLKHYSETE